MTSTELKIGLTNSSRPSSRVLKPPGGGHTNLFGEVDVKVNAPRPKYNQQNSSNLNACMNSIDPNLVVEKIQADSTVHVEQTAPAAAAPAPAPAPEAKKSPTSVTSSSSNDSQQKGRIPPGGFSSGGFW